MKPLYVFTPIGLFASVLVVLALAHYAWQRRDIPTSYAFFWFCINAVAWGVASTLTFISRTPAAAEFWFIKVRYIGVAFLPVTFFTFAVTYTGRARWLTPKFLTLLCIIPILTQLVNWFAPTYFFRDIRFERYGPFMFLIHNTNGPWFWVHAAHGYLLAITAWAMIGWYALSPQHHHRIQAMILFFGAFPPLLMNFAAVFRFLGELPPDVTLLSFTLTSIIWAWGLFRHHFLDIMPVARSAIVDSMDDVVIVLDRQNRVVDFNPAAQALLNWDSNAIGSPARDILADYPHLIEEYENAEKAHAEVTFDEGDAQRTYDLHISSLYQQPRKIPVGRLIVLRNITARKRAEEERERLIDELDAYAHTVAHDLKTPLTSLVGFSSLLVQHYDQMEPERIATNLSIINQKGNQMTNIINELLLLASVRRLEDITVEALDMEAIVSDALQRFEQRIEEMQAHITLPDSWPVAAGYAPWVEEVWVNYISNALKYGGQPPRITIGWDYHNTSEETKAATSLRFWVRDNGPGLSPKQQAQLFTHFTRLHKTRAQGYGLGLSIVQRIVTKLNGEVGVESVMGKGSTFWFTLLGTQDLADEDEGISDNAQRDMAL